MKDTVKIDKKNTRIVAHRGLSGIETQNTAAAFIAAGNRSYYGIETDVHFTKDGKLVCIHDGDTLGVSGVEMNINASTYKEILGVTLRDGEGGSGPRLDLVVPTLEDYISICATYGKHSVLELKDPFTQKEVETIMNVVDNLGRLADTTFISFYPDDIVAVKRLDAKQSCQFLTDRTDDAVLELLVAQNVGLDVYYPALTDERIKKILSMGIALNCWTVDDAQTAERLASLGVGFITTNILE